MIRVLGAGFVTAGCGLWGFGASYRFLRQERQLQQLLQKLRWMHSALSWRNTPLPELLQLAASEKGPIDRLLLAISDGLSCREYPDGTSCVKGVLSEFEEILPQTKEMVLLLGSSLGAFDLPGQLRQLEIVAEECRQRLQKMEEERGHTLRNYRTFGLCAGAALAILLL